MTRLSEVSQIEKDSTIGDDQTKGSKSDRERQYHVVALICGI